MRHCEGEGVYVSVWKIGLLVFIAISTIFQHNIMITRLIRQGKAWMDLMNW
jgi:cytochrome c biogenesis protein ResB